MEDVGLLARMPNPLNSNRTITMCNGIHSRGVLGAVRALTDAMLRESNEQYIARNFPETQFGILMRVTVIEGETLTPDFRTEGTVFTSGRIGPDRDRLGSRTRAKYRARSGIKNFLQNGPVLPLAPPSRRRSMTRWTSPS
jgi:hypothetical protein